MTDEDRLDSGLSSGVDEIVQNALERASRAVTMHDNNISTDYEIVDIAWAAGEDFTVELGKRQIDEYIRTWELSPGWLVSLDFLQTSEREYHTVHRYRARWSVPTRRVPVPREGTASVYFSIEISKIKPRTSPVEVSFVVEASRSVHRPGRTRFREKWLRDVIESKALLRGTVDF